MERLEEVIVPRDHRLPILNSDLHVLSVPSLRDELTEIYQSHDWVYELVRAQSEMGEIRGRHPVLTGVIGDRPIVVKRLFHGGSTASLWQDRFLSAKRAIDLVEAARHLDEHEIPTPHLLFLAWVRQNGLVRVEAGFERLFGKDADHYFFEAERPPEDWKEKAGEIGALVARLHTSQFEHGDLNMMNIFFTDDGEVFILDLDKAEMHSNHLGDTIRSRNVARLERSIRKQGRLHGRDHHYVDGLVERVLRVYEEQTANRS